MSIEDLQPPTPEQVARIIEVLQDQSKLLEALPEDRLAYQAAQKSIIDARRHAFRVEGQQWLGSLAA